MLAIIGGSGLTQFPGVEILERIDCSTPYGAPSCRVVKARLKSREFYFLPRHGEGHRLAPHQINYRANIWALHQLGAKDIIAVNAVGGIDTAMPPGRLIIPDQIIDYTWGRDSSFLLPVDGFVHHIDFTQPYSMGLREALKIAADNANLSCEYRGTYGCMQGPRLETAAEIRRLARDGCDLVGMTAMPEAALARELDVNYAALCLVVNWAAGLGDEGSIQIQAIQQVLESGMAQVRRLLGELITA